MSRIRFAASFVSLALLGAGLLNGQSALAARSAKLDFQFVNHIQAGLPEQDVFIERADTPPGQVARVEGAQANDPATLAKTVFTTATSTDHDPFKLGPKPLGPYPKGSSLNLTLQQWLAGTATGTYAVDGDKAELRLTTEKLVPNGTYTVWCSRLTFPPNAKVVDAPCGAADGSQNVFMTDARGNGTFNVTTKPLPESSKETATVIALAYHSDGKASGAQPGEFGSKSHVHVFALLPVPEASTLPKTGGAPADLTLGLLTGAVVAAGGWLLRRRVLQV